jgi:hypothetical protein
LSKGGEVREVAGVFLTEKHAPDAVVESIGRWLSVRSILDVGT